MYEILVNVLYSVVAVLGIGYYVYRDGFVNFVFALLEKVTKSHFAVSKENIAVIFKASAFFLLFVVCITVIWTKQIDITESTLSLFSRVVGLVTAVEKEEDLPPNLNLDSKFLFYNKNGELDITILGGEVAKFSRIFFTINFRNADIRGISFRVNSIDMKEGIAQFSFEDTQKYIIPAGEGLFFPIFHMTDMSVLAEGLKKDSMLPIIFDIDYSYGYEDKMVSRKVRVACRNYVKEAENRQLAVEAIYFPNCNYTDI